MCADKLRVAHSARTQEMGSVVCVHAHTQTQRFIVAPTRVEKIDVDERTIETRNYTKFYCLNRILDIVATQC